MGVVWVAGLAGLVGFFAGYLLRDVIATRPRIPAGPLDLTVPAARGELHLNERPELYNWEFPPPTVPRVERATPRSLRR